MNVRKNVSKLKKGNRLNLPHRADLWENFWLSGIESGDLRSGNCNSLNSQSRRIAITICE